MTNTFNEMGVRRVEYGDLEGTAVNSAKTAEVPNTSQEEVAIAYSVISTRAKVITAEILNKAHEEVTTAYEVFFTKADVISVEELSTAHEETTTAYEVVSEQDIDTVQEVMCLQEFYMAREIIPAQEVNSVQEIKTAQEITELEVTSDREVSTAQEAELNSVPQTNVNNWSIYAPQTELHTDDTQDLDGMESWTSNLLVIGVLLDAYLLTLA